MTPRTLLAIATFVGTLLIGCATIGNEASTGGQSASAPVYRTGSRLPSSGSSSTGAPVGAVSPEDWANNRREGTPTSGTKGQ